MAPKRVRRRRYVLDVCVGGLRFLHHQDLVLAGRLKGKADRRRVMGVPREGVPYSGDAECCRVGGTPWETAETKCSVRDRDAAMFLVRTSRISLKVGADRGEPALEQH